MQTLPLSIQATGIAALPTLPFNPGMALTSAILNLVRGIPLQTLGQLQWNVPDRNGLALLTAEPVLTLTTLLTGMGSNPVRLSPCGQHCDARAALAALT
jgi:hypothetical protein